MTNDLLGWEGVRPLVPRLQRLLELARKRSVTVIFSSLAFCSNGADSGQLGKFWEQIGKGEVLVKGTQGVAILPELSPRAGEQVLERNRYSAFFNSELDGMLREKGIETLIIGGYSTNFCCDSTARRWTRSPRPYVHRRSRAHARFSGDSPVSTKTDGLDGGGVNSNCRYRFLNC